MQSIGLAKEYIREVWRTNIRQLAQMLRADHLSIHLSTYNDK